MRTLQTQEVQAVSGAGLLTSTVKTGAEAGAVAGQGLVAAAKGLASAGAILSKPLVSALVTAAKFLI
jgi:hypothetical protein